jgi:hypothetical protein
MIKEKDYQLWFESVGSDGKVGILIEGGEIVSVNGEKVNKKSTKKDKKGEAKEDTKAEDEPGDVQLPLPVVGEGDSNSDEKKTEVDW